MGGWPQTFSCGSDRISEREECDKGVWSVLGYEEAALGTALLGEGVLCQHSRPERRANKKICKVADKERQNHESTQVVGIV